LRTQKHPVHKKIIEPIPRVGPPFLIEVWNCSLALLDSEIAIQFNHSDRTALVNDYHKIYKVAQGDLGSFFKSHKNSTLIIEDSKELFGLFKESIGFKQWLSKNANRLHDIELLNSLVEIAVYGKIGVTGVSGVTPFGSSQVLSVKQACSQEHTDGTPPTSKVFLKGLQILTRYHNLKKQVLAFSDYLDDTGVWGPLSLSIQILGKYALTVMGDVGIRVDQNLVVEYNSSLQEEINSLKAVLQPYGVEDLEHPGRSLQKFISRILRTSGFTYAKNRNGTFKCSDEDLESIGNQLPRYKDVLKAFIAYRKCIQNQKSLLVRLRDRQRVYPEYSTPTSTGRTSSRSGQNGVNIQGVPKDPYFTLTGKPLALRKCFIPEPGDLFLIFDIKQAELCALAQVCIYLFGYSKLADLINSGECVHTLVAAEILKKDRNNVTQYERDSAKVLNFGIPGGMGIAGIVSSARDFGIEISEKAAKNYIDTWLNHFPEVRDYLNPKTHTIYEAFNLGGDEFFQKDPTIAESLFLRVLGGETTSRKGNLYSETIIDWVWQSVWDSGIEFPTDLYDDIRNSQGSRKLREFVAHAYTESNATGRVRGKMCTTQRSNYQFQSLVADGAKLALFDLVLHGYQPRIFVHDEIVISLKRELALNPNKIQEIEQIIQDAMKKVIPDISISLTFDVSESWNKPK
jgi:hypothetical protein